MLAKAKKTKAVVCFFFLTEVFDLDELSWLDLELTGELFLFLSLVTASLRDFADEESEIVALSFSSITGISSSIMRIVPHLEQAALELPFLILIGASHFGHGVVVYFIIF